MVFRSDMILLDQTADPDALDHGTKKCEEILAKDVKRSSCRRGAGLTSKRLPSDPSFLKSASEESAM